MAVRFTEEQQKVIDTRNRNLLVSAAAGSGKTAVLVERIIQMITDPKHPMDIDRLLVVTFTNAAAAEMRERIQIAIEQRLAMEPENLHLQKQSALIHKAQITTIDSFCLFVVRNNFNDLGLDPGFRVADEGELRLLQKDTLSEMLEQEYASQRPEFLDCVEYFTGGSNDRLLEEYIEGLYTFSVSYPWPEEWLLQSLEDYKITSVSEMENSDWCRFMMSHVTILWTELIQKLQKAYALTERPAGPYMYGELLEREVEMLGRVAQKRSFSEWYEAMETVSFGRLPSKKDDSVDANLRTMAQQIRNDVKKQIDGICKDFFLFSPEQVVTQMQTTAPMVEELVRLVRLYSEMLASKKREANIIDFSDMEHLALQILLKKEGKEVVPTNAALEYRQCFDEILIDEYQDSNLVQEYLLTSISGERDGKFNRFMVGDVKQSIYKFRLARPELFMEKYDSYGKEEGECQRIDLHKNFRSRREVVESVNEVFQKLMYRQFGGITYNEEEALYYGASYPENTGNETEYLLIEKQENGKESARAQEALAIAQRIRSLRSDFQVTDKETGTLRPVRYGDIVILLRTTSGWAEEFKETLQKEGIPAYVSLRTGYFQASEVREVIQFLHVIDNPLQDIPLFGTLKSYFGGFSEEEIAKIRAYSLQEKKSGNLYRQMKEYEGELQDKISDFLQMLESYREEAVYTPIHKLLEKLIYDTGYLEYVTAKAGGEQRKANVEMLLMKAVAFEQTSFYGVFHFLRYMEQLEKYEVDYGEADILSEHADVVRIMSIHKSKGLEFPICFVAGMTKRFNLQDTTGRLVTDMDMGIGTDDIDRELRIQRSMIKKNVVSTKLRLDTLAEEMRVLYVAMTRAREKLILTGTIPEAEKFQEKIAQYQEIHKGEEVIGFAELITAGCALDFVMPVLERAIFITPETQMKQEVREAYDLQERKQQLLSEIRETAARTETEQLLLKQMGRTYEHRNLCGLMLKTSVSELKKEQMEMDFAAELFPEKEVVPYIPAFMKEEQEVSGTERGSAYHKVMELLDFSEVIQNEATKDILKKQLEDMVAEERLTTGWRDVVSVSKLQCFFASKLSQRMAQAQRNGKLYREQPFVLGIPANRVKPGFPEEEMVLIQGIIDAFFEEDGELVLMDYKTDAVKEGEELIKRYHSQLEYYTEALERITGKQVKQRIIYSFALGNEILM